MTNYNPEGPKKNYFSAPTQRTRGHQRDESSGDTIKVATKTRYIQQKCDKCNPYKMAGKNFKSQLPMTEINYLPPVEKTNQEFQWDYIGPIRFKHRSFYILLSIDQYN